MTRLPVLIGLMALASAPAALAAEAPADGKTLFVQHCGMCHGAVGMGTGLLARRLDPAIAELEKRDNLTSPYVIRAARIGVGNMPPVTRGELNDADMARIAAYLAKGK